LLWFRAVQVNSNSLLGGRNVKTWVTLLTLFCHSLAHSICIKSLKVIIRFIIEDSNINYSVIPSTWNRVNAHIMNLSTSSRVSIKPKYSRCADMSSEVLITLNFIWRKAAVSDNLLFLGCWLWFCIVFIVTLLMLNTIQHFKVFVHYLWKLYFPVLRHSFRDLLLIRGSLFSLFKDNRITIWLVHDVCKFTDEDLVHSLNFTLLFSPLQFGMSFLFFRDRF
jgi:hypothetical protein